MVKDIKKILEQKLFLNSDEEKISKIFKQHSFEVNRKNIYFHNGTVSLKNIPSALRLNVMMKKGAIMDSLKKEGFYVRDIL